MTTEEHLNSDIYLPYHTNLLYTLSPSILFFYIRVCRELNNTADALYIKHSNKHIQKHIYTILKPNNEKVEFPNNPQKIIKDNLIPVLVFT